MKANVSRKSPVEEGRERSDRRKPWVSETGGRGIFAEQSSKTKREASPIKRRVIVAQILHSPRVTEKASFLAEQGKYVFKVFKSANKQAVKKAVEDLYKVKVARVNIINLPSKKRAWGRFQGRVPGYKKAIVSLVKGQKIESLS